MKCCGLFGARGLFGSSGQGVVIVVVCGPEAEVAIVAGKTTVRLDLEQAKSQLEQTFCPGPGDLRTAAIGADEMRRH